MLAQRDEISEPRTKQGRAPGRAPGLLRCGFFLLAAMAAPALAQQPGTPPVKPAAPLPGAARPDGAQPVKPVKGRPAKATARDAASASADGQPAPQGAASDPPGASSISAYEEAVNAFKYQDFDNAIKRLRALLYPRCDLERGREWRAREYLGAALWWHDSKQASLDEFTALLVRNPQARLDPTFYPPQMIKDYEILRANLVRLGVLRADQKAAPLKRKPPTLPPATLAWVPFGVGQLANDEPLRGAAFMLAEIALGATSVALYNMNALDTGVDESRRAWQISTGVGFWLVAAWGIVDAVLQRRDLAKEFGATSGAAAALPP